jgi:hypothetical protein
MILINLLPQEHRAKQRTPVKYMLAVAGSVAVNSSLAAVLAWTAFGEAAEVKSQLQVLEDQAAGLRPQVEYHNSLESESKLFKSREETLSRITANRISWTRKVDELVDLVHKGGDGEKYLIWFSDLNVDQVENKRRKSFGEMTASGFSGSENFAHVANFLEDVELARFIDDFSKPAPPEGSQATKDDQLMPAEVWNFPLELTLRAPEERKRAHDERAKALSKRAADAARAAQSPKPADPKAATPAKGSAPQQANEAKRGEQ